MSVKKTVTFSSHLENYEIIENFSPNLSPMVLRSRCKAYGCTADISVSDSLTNSSQRISSNHIHHHHHHHHDASPKVTVSPIVSKASSILRQVTSSSAVRMTESHHASSATDVKKNLSASFQDALDVKRQKNNLNLDTATGLKVKEGYEEVIINNRYPAVILRELYSSSKLMNSDYSSGYDDEDDEEGRPKTDYTYSRSRSYIPRETPSRDKISPNMSRTRLHHSKNGEFSSDDESSFRLFGKNTSTYLSYNENHESSTPMFRQNDWSLNRETEQHSHRSSLDRNVFQRFASFIYYTCFWGFLSTIWSSWSAIWKGIYKVITSVLIADTYLLSRIRRRKYLLLLPLLLLLLWFWLFTGPEDSSVTQAVTSSTAFTTVSSYLAFLSSWNGYKEWWFFPAGVRSDDSYRKLEITDGQLDMDRIRQLLTEIVTAESKTAFQRYATQREELVDKILQDLRSESLQMKKSQDLNYQNLLYQSKILSNELVSIKAVIADGESSKLISVNHATEFDLLRNKLVSVEEKLDSLEIEIAAQRNCCKNQTAYMQEADRHFTNLLFNAFSGTSGSDDEKITRLRETIQSRFVNRDDLKAQLNQMTNLLSGDLIAKFTTMVQEEAKVTVADSVNKLRAEIKYNESQKSARNQASYSVIATNRTDKCTSEDEVQRIVKNALFVYDADKTGQVDFALESSGGSVISTRCAETYHTGSAQYRIFGIPFWYTSNSPRTVIQPEVHPGLCWAFKGTQGYLVIQLSGVIRPTAFSLEHIHKSLSPTGKIDSAPKDFNVYGLKREDDFDGKLLGRYQYKDNNESLQYFIVKDPDPGEFSIVELRINSNHGNNDYTCIYRFRVHGVKV